MGGGRLGDNGLVLDGRVYELTADRNAGVDARVVR